jgi:hypothetical protein
MRIIDYRNLVDPDLLEMVAKHHPLYSDIASEIRWLTVQEKDHGSVRIEMDRSRDVTLTIHPMIRPSQRDLYILYHEFGHIADRINPRFRYDHDKRLQLTQTQETCFLQLWNVYIDTRLNEHGLFRLPEGGQAELIVDGQRYVLPRNKTSTYLLEACAALSQRGVRRPGGLVTGIWNHPKRWLTFEDLLDPVT